LIVFIIIESIYLFMYSNHNHHDSSTSPLFRNTRSRLYKKRSSFEDESSSNQQHPLNSAQAWKHQGNEAFKQRNYDKAIECYSKAIVVILAI
jgi:tetratricopeptide (TPR) repeat protein